jgi:predicted glycosyltransferase
MRVLIEIGHPAHVHQFRHVIYELRRKGHEVCVATTDKEITLALLNAYKLEYALLGVNKGGGVAYKSALLLKSFLKMLTVVKIFKPDIFVSRGSPVSAITSRLLNKPHISFYDTEHTSMQDAITVPLTDTIIVPSCYQKNHGQTQIAIDGYKELMYLHPARFTPNPAVLTELGLAEGDPFIIVRFVSWQASHDVGQHGIRDKVGLVKALEQYGRVLITSEGALPPELQPYQIRVSPEKLHDLLYYATLYVGEGGTTASEAAVLGTPSIYVSSLVGTMGNFIELEETYDLLYSFTDGGAALDKAVEILQDPKSKDKWRIKRDRLLTDKIDVTEFMVWFVENYPRSFTEMKEHPEAQYSCASVPGGAL